jgi:superfamily I DNA/RNA helicase
MIEESETPIGGIISLNPEKSGLVEKIPTVIDAIEKSNSDKIAIIGHTKYALYDSIAEVLPLSEVQSGKIGITLLNKEICNEFENVLATVKALENKNIGMVIENLNHAENVMYRNFKDKYPKLDRTDFEFSSEYLVIQFLKKMNGIVKYRNISELETGLAPMLGKDDQNDREYKNPKKLLVFSTIHRIKGLTFPTVVYLPDTRDQIDEAKDDPNKLIYVALSRTSGDLFIVG